MRVEVLTTSRFQLEDTILPTSGQLRTLGDRMPVAVNDCGAHARSFPIKNIQHGSSGIGNNGIKWKSALDGHASMIRPVTRKVRSDTALRVANVVKRHHGLIKPIAEVPHPLTETIDGRGRILPRVLSTARIDGHHLATQIEAWTAGITSVDRGIKEQFIRGASQHAPNANERWSRLVRRSLRVTHGNKPITRCQPRACAKRSARQISTLGVQLNQPAIKRAKVCLSQRTATKFRAI